MYARITPKFPVDMMIYCDGCEKHFDIVIPGKGPRDYACPACEKVHAFDLEAFITRALAQCQSMQGKSPGPRPRLGDA